MKLWGIGDSFMENFYDPSVEDNGESQHWFNLVRAAVKPEDWYCNGRGSRDTQTILDIFFQHMHQMKSDDVVFLFLPDARWRIPNKQENDTFSQKSVDYYVGSGQFKGEVEEILRHFVPSLLNNRSELSQYNLVSQLTEATIENYHKILESIKKTFSFKVIFLSWNERYWSNEYLNTKEPLVWNRSYLTEKIGFWETKNDLYDRGDAVPKNFKRDHHWSMNMHKHFAEFIIKEVF